MLRLLFVKLEGKEFSLFEIVIASVLLFSGFVLLYFNISTSNLLNRDRELLKTYYAIKSGSYSIMSSLKPDRIFIYKDMEGPMMLPEPLGDVQLPEGIVLHYLYRFYSNKRGDVKNQLQFAVSSEGGDTIYRYVQVNGFIQEQRILKTKEPA